MNKFLIIGILLMIAGSALGISCWIRFGFFAGYVSLFILFVPGYWISKVSDDLL